MSFFAVLLALVIEQFKPLPRDNWVHHALVSWVGWTGRNFDAGRERHAWVVWFVSVGVPGALLPLVIALELIGGLVLMLGWHTRLTAFLLAGFTILATLIFHSNIGDQTQFLFFMKNLSIAGGLLLVVSHGAGPYSVDNRQRS